MNTVTSLMELHEGRKKKAAGKEKLFTLLVDSITDDEEINEAHLHINGDEEFRLEIEELAESGGNQIRVSVYRNIGEEHVHSSIHAEMDFVKDGSDYFFVNDDERKLSLEQVYEEIMHLIRKVEKIKFE
jgi:hypothetical protein